MVGAEQQYITYTEFLPSLGVALDRYRGYKPSVDAELYDEFATAGYRAHSMVNGEEHIVVGSTRYTPAQLDRSARHGGRRQRRCRRASSS